MSELLNKLVANDKYGQLVKTGTTVRRASLHLLPLARFCVCLISLTSVCRACTQVHSPMNYPAVPWATCDGFWNDAASFASDSSELIDAWQDKQDEPPEDY